jgi:arylsulfatase A-like enzyme
MVPQELWDSAQPLEECERDAVFAEDNNGNYMARTEKYKLLYCQKAKSQFFDLTNDEYEMNNLIDNPKYQEEIQKLKERFVKWLAFEARSRPHVDEYGPIIRGENVPPLGGEHRKLIKDYLEKKMEEEKNT